MNIGTQISVTITRGKYEGKTLLLDVEEYLPFEPSNYVWVPGWNCSVGVKGEFVWLFVDETGDVYDGAERIGICPAQEENFNERVGINEWRSTCGCGDPGDCGEDH